MSPAALRIVRASPGLEWRARHGGQVVGTVSALVRPDHRCFVFLDACRDDAAARLLSAVAGATGGDLHACAEEADEAELARYARLGFEIGRRESNYLIPTDPDVTGLPDAGRVPMPPGLASLTVISALDADEDRLRLLDDALQQDVPGADGWRWDAPGFRQETFGEDFDPATYLVAADQASGEYVALVRVWITPGRPRLGLIAVLAPFRRRGLARALLGQALGVLHERGDGQVSAEVDDTNAASATLLTGLGARRTGGSVELIRRRGPAARRRSAIGEVG